MSLYSTIKICVQAQFRKSSSCAAFMRGVDYLRAPFRGDRDDSKVTLMTFFVCGMAAGLCLCWFVKGELLAATLNADLELARMVNGRAVSFANARTGGGSDEFAALNPFGADIPARGDAAAPAAAISALTVEGTLPGIGAWITGPDGTHLVLKGQDVAGYKLETIKYGEVILASGKEKHSLYLYLSGGTAAPMAAAPASGTQGGGKPKLDFSQIEAASEGKEGAVPRELVDALLMNPYDELGKMRMTPAPDGSGMKLERIAPDCVFARVGVAQGDVIQAINGVKISNMADATNAMNSLMAGTRFDVTVKRGDKPVELKYQVK